MKDKKLMKLYEDFCKKNDEEIKNKESFMPVCITIDKDYSLGIIAFTFDDQDQKIKMRETLKQFVAMRDIKGYILIQDAKVTQVHQETGERKVSDVAMRQLFTPKFAISRMQLYNPDGTFGEKIELTDRKEMNNNWDLWNEVEQEKDYDKHNEEYNKYKQEHPELYKGVYELDDYSKVKDKKGNLIYAFKVDDGKFKYYKADDLEQEDEEKLDQVMKMTKDMNDMFGHFEFIEVDKYGVEIKNA